MVEDVDLGSCRQDSHRKAELGKVEEEPNEEGEGDGNVGDHHCRLKQEPLPTFKATENLII